MLDRQLVEKRLLFLDEQIRFLRTLSTLSHEELIGDKRNLYSAQLSLVYAIEAILDIGSHLISAYNWEQIDSYADIARRLLQHKVLSQSQCELLVSLAGFRNVVVHGYLQVNTTTVHDAVRNRVGDLEQFAALFSSYI